MPGPFSEYLRDMGVNPITFGEGAASASYGGGMDDPGMVPEAFNAGPYGDPYVPHWSGNFGRITEETPSGQAVQQATPVAMGMRVADPAAMVSSSPQAGEIQNYIREAARRRGIMEQVALEIAEREGGTGKYEGNMGQFPTGRSHWAYQLHYGGAGTPYAQWGTTAGMGNDFTQRTGFRPGDPAAWQAAIDFALDHARANGWGAWYGRQANPKRGLREIGEWEGIPR